MVKISFGSMRSLDLLSRGMCRSDVRGRSARQRGMTLVETTLVLLVLLTLVSVLLVAASGWKRGTNRARCILNIRQMQMSVRAYASAASFDPGRDLTQEAPPINLLSELVGPGSFVPELPHCPGRGLYFFGGDVIPEIGSLYLRCSLASQGHEPEQFGNW